MIFLMTHPIHGAMYVYTQEEIPLNEANGWVLHHDDVEPAPYVATPSVVKSLAERYAEKFGKPPHHRMKAATIEAALER